MKHHLAPHTLAPSPADNLDATAGRSRAVSRRSPAATAWRDELLLAVRESYAGALAGVPDQAVLHALDAALEASLFEGLRTGNHARVRSLRRRFEATLSDLGEAARAVEAAAPAAAAANPAERGPRRRRGNRGNPRRA
jgi:hypothetical protein